MNSIGAPNSLPFEERLNKRLTDVHRFVVGHALRHAVDEHVRRDAYDDRIGSQKSDQTTLQSSDYRARDKGRGHARSVTGRVEDDDENHRGDRGRRAQRKRHDVAPDGNKRHCDREATDEGNRRQQRC